MYLWNTKKLIEDLKHNQVTETQFKNYYLVGSSLLLLSGALVNFSPAIDVKLSWAEFIIQLGLLISWTNAMFKVNGGEQGKLFISRFVALSVPISIKLLVIFSVIYLVVVIIVGVLLTVLGFDFEKIVILQNRDLRVILMNIAFSFVAYWRIYVAMKAINS